MAAKGAKKKRAKRRKQQPTEGMQWEFHGAYKRKADAEAKARKVKGFTSGRFTKKSGDFRYVVMTERTPF